MHVMCAVCVPWPTDLQLAGAANLAFDHFSEMAGSVGVLACQVFADGVEIHWIDVLHAQRAIDGESLLRLGLASASLAFPLARAWPVARPRL